MVSIIICSRNKEIPEPLLSNIEATIGVPFELVIVNNTQNKLTIFQAYNIGVSKSNFPYLCFMHDDILFHTFDWGKAVCRHFEDKTIGAIGIAGGKYLGYMPGTWWSSGFWEQNIIHTNKVEETTTLDTVVKTEGSRSDVTAVDGVWFCIPKELFRQIRFDEHTFKGFHYYDLDICMQIATQGYKIYVVFDILMEHFSKGSLNKSWLQNALIFQQKWRAKLPVSLLPLRTEEAYNLELKMMYQFLDRLKEIKTGKEINKIAFKLLLGYRGAFRFLHTPVLLAQFLRKSISS